MLVFNQTMEAKSTEGYLAYIETQPSNQIFELCV
jgi:hypothetical protein